MIDDCFTVTRQPWGTFVSVGKDGSRLVTSETEEACLNATRYHLKRQQDNESENYTDAG